MAGNNVDYTDVARAYRRLAMKAPKRVPSGRDEAGTDGCKESLGCRAALEPEPDCLLLSS
jgi:hypothetical protein